MRKANNRLEQPLIGYVVMTVALVAGIVAANAFGQPPSRTIVHQPSRNQRFVPPVHQHPQHDQHHALRRWILGVSAEATDTGYLIRQVEPHSAAKGVGLEPGDRLIAIDGVQIGHLGHRLMRLSDTLERQGGHDGRVRLLIQNRRNHRLVSLPVQLRHPAEHLGH